MHARCFPGLGRATLLLTGAMLAVAALQGTASAQWKPSKPINLIIPATSGSPPDQVTRLAIGELEEALGGKVAIVNQPGNNGVTGTRNVVNGPRDGYTWGAGSVTDLGMAKVSGLAETSLDDWNVFLLVATAPVVSAAAATPYKDFGDLLQTFKEKPNTVRVATAGGASIAQQTIDMIRKQVPFQYKAVSLDDGKPSVFATVGGEADVLAQMAPDQVDMLRTHRLRALAVVSDQPLTIEGYGDVPPVSQWVQGFTNPPNYLGLWVHKNAPAEEVEAINAIWKDKIANSEKLKKYAASRGAYFTPYVGDDAKSRVMVSVQHAAYLLHDAGKSKMDPAKAGIQRVK
ncbi:MAG TPA: tripartite tricarboxylate transporter substrate-binding protein [bacterium]